MRCQHSNIQYRIPSTRYALSAFTQVKRLIVPRTGAVFRKSNIKTLLLQDPNIDGVGKLIFVFLLFLFFCTCCLEPYSLRANLLTVYKQTIGQTRRVLYSCFYSWYKHCKGVTKNIEAVFNVGIIITCI